MDKVTFDEVTLSTGKTEIIAIIDNGDGSFTSMTKAHWDELEAQREQNGTL